MGVSKAEFAREVGVSRQRISALVHEGRLPALHDGTLDPKRARIAYSKLRTNVQRGEVLGGARVALTQEDKIVDYTLRARRAKAEVAEARAARFVDSARAARKVARALRSRFARLAPTLVNEPVRRIRAALRAELAAIVELIRASPDRNPTGATSRAKGARGQET